MAPSLWQPSLGFVTQNSNMSPDPPPPWVRVCCLVGVLCWGSLRWPPLAVAVARLFCPHQACARKERKGRKKERRKERLSGHVAQAFLKKSTTYNWKGKAPFFGERASAPLSTLRFRMSGLLLLLQLLLGQWRRRPRTTGNTAPRGWWICAPHTA